MDSIADTDVFPGQVLAGKFRIETVLGRGGMGVVVAATHVHLDEKVALKFLLPEALASQETVRRFEREARAAVKIKSEHVARVTDVGSLETGAPYMVMEYLNGMDLGDYLSEQGPLPYEEAVDYLLQACEAIAEAHSLGIVHRDLKPANLFRIIRSDGSPSIKVLDFGISKVLGIIPHSRGSVAEMERTADHGQAGAGARDAQPSTGGEGDPKITTLGGATHEQPTYKPPTRSSKTPLLVAAVLLVVGGGAAFGMMGGSQEAVEQEAVVATQPDAATDADVTAQAEKPSETTEPEPDEPDDESTASPDTEKAAPKDQAPPAPKPAPRVTARPQAKPRPKPAPAPAPAPKPATKPKKSPSSLYLDRK